jgi:hypothetical protein
MLAIVAVFLQIPTMLGAEQLTDRWQSYAKEYDHEMSKTRPTKPKSG